MTRYALALGAALLAVPALAANIAVDGDTVKVDGENTRLIGFDTPETFFAKCKAERALGLKAKVRLQALLDAGPAEFEFRPYRDKYRRRLAVLRIGGEDAAVIMVREGLAVPYKRGRRISWCARLEAERAQSGG